MPGQLGNLIVRKVTLVDNVTEGSFTPVQDARSLIVHSRNNFDCQVAFEVGGNAETGSKTFITLNAGVYMALPSDAVLDNVFFKSKNVGGDVIEIICGDSLDGMAFGTDLGFKP